MPCACQNTVYAGEPWRLFQTRKKEHMEKVRVTNEYLHKGNSNARKTDKQRGWRPSMAHHGVPKWCWWGNAEIVARERGLKQRKVLEGIEALRQRPPNSFDHDDTWKLICRRRWIKTKSKKYLIGLHFPRILTSFTRRVIITIRHVRLPSWTNKKKHPPYWKLFNNLKRNSKTGQNVGF